MKTALSVKMTIAELLEVEPSAGERLARHGMACVGCPMARFETVAEGAAAYGLDAHALLREIAQRSGSIAAPRSARRAHR